MKGAHEHDTSALLRWSQYTPGSIVVAAGIPDLTTTTNTSLVVTRQAPESRMNGADGGVSDKTALRIKHMCLNPSSSTLWGDLTAGAPQAYRAQLRH